MPLEHRKHDYSVFELPRSKARPRDALELRSMFLEIAEGLLLRVECRRKPARLPICAEREKEGDGSVARLGSRHDLHSPACDRPLQISAAA